MSKDVTSRRHFLKVAGAAAGAGLFSPGISLDAATTVVPSGGARTGGGAASPSQIQSDEWAHGSFPIMR